MIINYLLFSDLMKVFTNLLAFFKCCGCNCIETMNTQLIVKRTIVFISPSMNFTFKMMNLVTVICL